MPRAGSVQLGAGGLHGRAPLGHLLGHEVGKLGLRHLVRGDAQIVQVREALERGVPGTRIAENMGVSKDVVSRVKSGEVKTQSEARDAARAAGLYVDAVQRVAVSGDDTETHVYADIWVAAAATGKSPRDILARLDGAPVDGVKGKVRWVKCAA